MHSRHAMVHVVTFGLSFQGSPRAERSFHLRIAISSPWQRRTRCQRWIPGVLWLTVVVLYQDVLGDVRRLAAVMPRVCYHVAATHPGSAKFFPLLIVGIVLPRIIGGAIAVAIFQKGNTALYNENMALLVKAWIEGSKIHLNHS